MVSYRTIFSVYGNAWEVSYMLICTCKLIKQGCLSTVLVTRKGKCNLSSLREFLIMVVIVLCFSKLSFSRMWNIFMVGIFLLLLFLFLVDIFNFYLSCLIPAQGKFISP